MNWRDRIRIDPKIHHGKPCIKGTRVPISVIVGSVAEGNSFERIIDSWPQLSPEDISAALKFAAAAAATASLVAMQGDGQ